MALDKILMIKLGMVKTKITKFRPVIDFINHVITWVEKQQTFIDCLSGAKPIDDIEYIYIYIYVGKKRKQKTILYSLVKEMVVKQTNEHIQNYTF